MYLPRLTATNHSEAVAILRKRRALLLEAAEEAADLAESFNQCGYGDIADEFIAEARNLLAQAKLH